MASDLKYQSDAYLKKQLIWERRRQNTAQMRADAIQSELDRRATIPPTNVIPFCLDVGSGG